MPKLTIKTDSTIQEPIEVEIDGRVFTLQRINRDKLKEIEALDKEIAEGNLDGAYKRLEIFFGPSEVFSKLDLSEVGQIVRFVVRGILNPEQAVKNALEPGDKPPLS